MFQSLNDESATDTRTKSANSGEKEIQTCLEQYRRTLRIDASDTQTIRDAYKQLLQKRVLLETNDIGVVANIQGSPLHTLLFVVHRNYALFVERADGDICASLQHMTKAARVDPASSNTWAHVGRLALLAEEVPAACEAYEMALQTCGNKIEYWIALKGLSEATFKAGDFETCLRVVDQAIALNPSFEDGITMRNEMENECNRILSTRPKKAVATQTVQELTLNPKSLTCTHFAELLLDTLQLEAPDPSPLLTGRVVFSMYPPNSVDTEMRDINVPIVVAVADETVEDETTPQSIAMDVEPAAIVLTGTEVSVSEHLGAEASGEGQEVDTVEGKEQEEEGSVPSGEASPVKRRRRRSYKNMEITRTSKRVKDDRGRADKEAEDVEMEHELVDDEGFLSTLNDEILPSLYPITFGEETFFPGNNHHFTRLFEEMLATIKNPEASVSATDEEISGRKTPQQGQSQVGGFGEFNSPGVESFNEHLITWISSLQESAATLTLMELTRTFVESLFVRRKASQIAEFVFRETAWPTGISRNVQLILCEMEAHGFGSSSYACLFDDTECRLQGEEINLTAEFTLSVCEFLFDSAVGLSKGVSLEASRLNTLTAVLEAWWSVVNQIVLVVPDLVRIMGGQWFFRKYWLQSLMAEHFALFSQAVDMYKKALDIAFEHAVDNIAYSNCMYNPLLSKETIKARLQTLSLEHHLRTAESTFEAGDFHVVYSMLHPLLFQDAFFGQWLKSVFFPDYARAEQENHAFLVSTLSLELGADQRLRALRMLSKCYFELDMVTESFMCRLLLLATELQSALDSKKLISSLKQISKLMKTILESMLLNEHEDLFQIMKDSAAVKPILAFMNLPNVSSVFALCVSCVFALVRLSWVIVKQCGFGRYRTDATLVNFSVRSWCLMFYLCKSLESDCEDRENIGMEWAFFAHQQLGEVSLCGRDNGILLKLITRHCIAKEGGESMVELYQALCCNYGTVITVDPDYPLLEHNSPTAPFTKASAAIIFSPLCKFLKCHLRTRNHRAISTDIRDAVDTIGEKFPEPPIRQHEVAYNRSLIDKFLSSDIQRRQTNPIGAMHLDPDKIPYLNVYRDLYYIRGKLACIQKRAIIGIKTKKSFENLESASEDYVHNLVVNPFSINAWILAADTFCSLSYEYLSWSASDLLANLELIRNLQVKSYHCYEQAIALLKNRNCTVFDDGQIESDLSTSERAMLIWGNFGFLCYSMVAQPMNGLATKSSRWKSNEAWIMRYSELAGTEGEPLEPNFRGRDDILQRGMECFKRAQQIDSTEWRFPFMMAKIAAMMNADFRNIVSHFKLAITLLPEEWATKEQENILDVHYCLISYLCKGLHTQKLEAPFVLNCLDDISLNKDGGLSPIDIEPQSDSSLVAYQRILQELGYMKSLDKKKWQHRPYWKSHWILRTIFNDPERAKNDLLNIFQLRSNARSYINFWRPEFERPGRHFVYVHKYTLSLISILRDCKDLESLRHLVRKCQKASDVLLYPQTIWKAGFDAVVDILSEKVTDSIWVQFVKSIPQKEFLAHAPPIEKKMFGGSADEKVESASLLHSAFNLKKLNENMEDETVLSRILVQLYCKLFLANMNVVANVEENETLSEDTSLYFTIVLRRCLIACKIPWSKRAAAEEAQQEPDASVAPASEKSKEPTDIQTTKAGNEEFRISHPDLVMELPDDASPDENADSGIIQKVAGKDFGDTSNTDMEVANL